MTNTPTAKEFILSKNLLDYNTEDLLIEFAKLHVEAQIQKIIDDLDDSLSIGVYNTVRNAYPLENIK